jgi:hypothetical protein
MRVTLLPPLPQSARQDIHALVDVAKAADVILLCLPQPSEPPAKRNVKAEGHIDEHGALALQILRSMGLPEILVAVQVAGQSLKERAAAKKHATASLQAQLPGDIKVRSCIAHICAHTLAGNYSSGGSPCRCHLWTPWQTV